MNELVSGEIAFAIHSARPSDDPNDTKVNAAVFAQKLAALVRALEAADEALNGSRRYEFTIAKLHTSTPTAILREHVVGPHPAAAPRGSAIMGYTDCAQAIAAGETELVGRYGDCPRHVAKLAAGAGRRFGYAETGAPGANVVRIDQFLEERAKLVTQAAAALAPPPKRWFKGVAQGSFVGAVEAVDLRGSMPEVKLILSAGGRELDCICRGLDVAEIRDALHRRVRLFGRAIYDGKSGLPRRLEVSRIEHFPADPDIARWAGAFEPFEPATWDEPN